VSCLQHVPRGIQMSRSASLLRGRSFSPILALQGCPLYTPARDRAKWVILTEPGQKGANGALGVRLPGNDHSHKGERSPCSRSTRPVRSFRSSCCRSGCPGAVPAHPRTTGFRPPRNAYAELLAWKRSRSATPPRNSPTSRLSTWTRGAASSSATSIASRSRCSLHRGVCCARSAARARAPESSGQFARCR
jgi:hypothetical protein